MWTKDKYFKHHDAFCFSMKRITAKKNSDYTGSGNDPFANFRKIEQATGGAVPVSAGFLTRMSDKFSRICSFVQKKGSLEVEDESIHDTLLDLANYCALLSGYFLEQAEITKINKIADAISTLPAHPLTLDCFQAQDAVEGL